MNKTTNSDENNHQSNDTPENKSLTADNKAQHAQSHMPADKTKKSKQSSFSLALPFFRFFL